MDDRRLQMRAGEDRLARDCNEGRIRQLDVCSAQRLDANARGPALQRLLLAVDAEVGDPEVQRALGRARGADEASGGDHHVAARGEAEPQRRDRESATGGEATADGIEENDLVTVGCRRLDSAPTKVLLVPKCPRNRARPEFGEAHELAGGEGIERDLPPRTLEHQPTAREGGHANPQLSTSANELR